MCDFFTGIETMLSDVDEIPAIELGPDQILKFELDPLSAFGIEVAERELRETPERKADAVEELRELLKGMLEKYCNRSSILFSNRHDFWFAEINLPVCMVIL